MKRHVVTIIGMGPRGLSVFERLAAAAVSRQLSLDVHLIEPGECGPGVHSPQQPPYLLINTLASQVTMFPAPGAVRDAPVCATPSLTEWVRLRGAQVADGDYLPRSVLGEYLAWVYRQIAAALPAGVALCHHRARAADLRRLADGRCEVVLDGGALVVSDFVFLTTGHGCNEPGEDDRRLARFAREHAGQNGRLAFVRQAYPVSQLAGIGSDARVAIQGLGLSAHDVIAELTVGRGGVFVAVAQGGQGARSGNAAAGALRYLPSGREPQLTLCSRHCMPYAARGINQKGLDGRHQPRHFTLDAVAALRRQALIKRGTSQLDFERDLLPLLKLEMAEVHRAAAAAAFAPAAAVADADALFAELLFPLQDRRFSTLAEFRRYFRAWLRADLIEAHRGNLASPAKAATDVLRDVRAVLQAAVEHGGLTPSSHRRFLQIYHPAINRAAYGPPLRRNQELLALLDAGILRIRSGPGSRIDTDAAAGCYRLVTAFASGTESHPVDVVVVARLDSFLPQTDTSLLIRNVLRSGLARPYENGGFHPGGIDIDANGRLLDAQGRALPSIWALGYLTEGAHYYTHALPRPGMRSRQVLDADRCVAAMIARIAPETAAKVRPRTVQHVSIS
ncbi:FAD/NAD(P)-binding protein [Duganella callida]|uniref:FAD-dependent urate hydroxylase HpyO/Asp monooxygenase CreE-like FAD/NAD(P)-binding domain-containing protein n=1 Tax=Duganella callida TaxID=2561932 RepID=A0A4Y9SAF0_9BURK|nr:FAD/NAD(P)-binding domain-containing protein [Duganella callida]TFW16548.1 hypothetical protein E4L98_23075 [Duganella callida]